MKNALEHLSEAARAALIEENTIAYGLHLGTLLQAEVYEDEQILRVITGFPSSTYNMILRAHFEPEEVDGKVEEALAAFGSPRLPLTWWIGPLTHTPHLAEALQAHGLIHALDAPGMAVDLRDLPAAGPTPPQFSMTCATDSEGIEQWVQTFAASYQFDEQAKQIWLTIHRHLGLKHAASCRYYVGWLGNLPVATSLLFLHNGVAGIYQVATLPEHRGQGIGTAMTSVPLCEALGQGYRIGVLESSLMAESLYRRLGFQQYCILSAYVWSA